mmetsp:Transcript_12232/g.42950  ORF Transcript_12232/g.42950 Transcript_12232/m.42950 type:complete len:244 (-) Transcript_12232:187-918(-)
MASLPLVRRLSPPLPTATSSMPARLVQWRPRTSRPRLTVTISRRARSSGRYCGPARAPSRSRTDAPCSSSLRRWRSRSPTRCRTRSSRGTASTSSSPSSCQSFGSPFTLSSWCGGRRRLATRGASRPRSWASPSLPPARPFPTFSRPSSSRSRASRTWRCRRPSAATFSTSPSGCQCRGWCGASRTSSSPFPSPQTASSRPSSSSSSCSSWWSAQLPPPAGSCPRAWASACSCCTHSSLRTTC